MLAARSLLRTKASTMSTNLPVEYFEPPRDPTIPGPDQYGDVSKEELPILCVLWRFGALYSRLRERPDEFRREFEYLIDSEPPQLRLDLQRGFVPDEDVRQTAADAGGDR